MSSPEELARQNIDALLIKCGWDVQGRKPINLDAARGVAIREALLKGGDEADYLLFVDRKAIGIVEAMRCACSTKRVDSLPLIYSFTH